MHTVRLTSSKTRLPNDHRLILWLQGVMALHPLTQLSCSWAAHVLRLVLLEEMFLCWFENHPVENLPMWFGDRMYFVLYACTVYKRTCPQAIVTALPQVGYRWRVHKSWETTSRKGYVPYRVLGALLSVGAWNKSANPNTPAKGFFPMFFPKKNYKIHLHNISYLHHPHIHYIICSIYII